MIYSSHSVNFGSLNFYVIFQTAQTDEKRATLPYSRGNI